MSKVVYRHADGTEHILDVESGQSLMQAAVANGIPGIVGECGGELMCATCHVFVDSPDVGGPASADEDEMLEFAVCSRRTNSRLSCQLVADADTEFIVETPEAQN